MKIIICCQHCLRAYETDASKHGKLGRCDVCKSYFNNNVAEHHHPGDDVVIFDKPIEPYYIFMHEAMSCLARNVRDLLRLADCPFDRETALQIVATLPVGLPDESWKLHFFGQIHRRAFERAKGMNDLLRFHELTTYFFFHLTAMYGQHRLSLIGAFNGVLSVEFETPPRKELAVIRKRGRLERFAERRGW